MSALKRTSRKFYGMKLKDERNQNYLNKIVNIFRWSNLDEFEFKKK
jgi:hypothetical protein